MSGCHEHPADPASALETLRARDTARVDPVRWRFIEALARRSAAHQGPSRRLLDERLRQLLSACDPAPKSAQRQPEVAAQQGPRRDTLADLLAYIQQQTGTASPSTSTRAELKTVSRHRGTWTRLGVDQRMTQALAQVPDNAGPLNTQRLLNQALMLMRDASPQYLQHFMSYVETLLWIDQAQLPGQAPSKDGNRRARKRQRP
jgi:hypothetical protein